MGFRLSPGPVDIHLHEVLEKVPKGAAAVIAASLTPALESLIDVVIAQVQEALKEENTCRKSQGLYVLRYPRLEHFIGSLASLGPILEELPPMLEKAYGESGLLWVGGEPKGEEEVSGQPGLEANPQGGEV